MTPFARANARAPRSWPKQLSFKWYSYCSLAFIAIPASPFSEDKPVLLRALFLSLALSASFTTPAQAAFASLMAASQWEAGEQNDAFLNAPVCRASTKATNSAEPIEVFFAYPKDGKILPMVGLRTKLNPALIAIKISRKETEYFFPVQSAANNEDSNLYWYAPVDFAGLESLVKNDDNLELTLDPKGAATAVKVSLKGSGNALDAARKCLKAAKGSVPADFFKLLNAKKEDLNPNLGDRSPQLMFQSVQEAFAAYQAGLVINAEIEKLRKANAPLLSKEKAALSTLKKANEAFVSAKTKLDTATTLVDKLNGDLSKSKKELADLQAEKPRAEADLAAKKAIYLPLKQQMLPYEQAVSKANKAVKDMAEAIEDNEKLISRNTRLIPQLESEKSSLQRQIPGMESRVNSTRRDYDDADSDYRRYDVNREYRNLLDRDFNYSWAKRDMEQGQRELSQAQSQLSSAQSALNSCRSQQGANCSSQESAVNQAHAAVSSAQSKISNARWKMQSAESDAHRKVQSESDRLRRIRDDAESAYNRARNELNNAHSRIEEIRSLIPRLRSQIKRAEEELPGQRAQLASLQAELANRIREKDTFANSIGFPVAEANFNAATKHLAEVNDGIKDLSKAIPKITKELASAQKTIPGLTKTFTRTQAELKSAQEKLAPISEQLKPFRAQEKVQLDALAVEAAKFKNGKAVYQELYLELTR